MTIAERTRIVPMGRSHRARRKSWIRLGVASVALIASAANQAAGQQRMTRVSETTSIWGNSYAARDPTGGSMSASADGRYVAFDSDATNLLDYDVDGRWDTYRIYANIFVEDRTTGGLVRITTGNGYSWDPVLSGDGRFVAFLSIASNLVANDTNAKIDVFLHDRDPDGNGIFDEGNGTTTRMSVDSSGNECNGDCSLPSISDDGSLVVFISNATNLVSGDTNGANDAFMRDVVQGKTSRVSVTSAGKQIKFGADCASIAPNGGVVAFDSYSGDIVSGDSNGAYDVFIYDVKSGVTTERVSVSSNGGDGNGNSLIIPRCLSHDGTIVAFSSTASNLVSGDTNARSDVFIRNRSQNTTKLASQTSGGQIGNYDSLDATIDAAGDRVAFHSDCTNLGPDYNGLWDVYVHDFANGTTTLVSANRSGIAGDYSSPGGVIAPTGDFVAFASNADDLVTGDPNGNTDVFIRDLKRSTTECISWIPPGQVVGVFDYGGAPIFNGDCDVSGNGKWLAFASYAWNLVPLNASFNFLENVYVKDRLTGKVVRVSIDSNGYDGDGDSYWPSISFDGRFVSFTSKATNWFGISDFDDVNIYVYDRDPDGNGIFDENNGVLELISVSLPPYPSPIGASYTSSISESGRYVAFSSYGGWLLDRRCDYNTYGLHNNVFVHDRVNGTTSLVSFESTGTTDANDSSDLPAFSADESTIVYVSAATNILAADNDALPDIYSWNLATGTTTLLSVNSAGMKQKSISEISRRPVSSDGMHIVFICNDPSFDASKTTNHFDVYLRDLTSWPTPSTTNLTTIIFSGEPNSDSSEAVISPNGGLIAFTSAATNLFAGDKNGAPDVFWYDRTADSFTVASTKDDTISGDDWSYDPVVLDDGKVIFASAADDLVHDDTNGYPDLFQFDPTVRTGAAWIPYGAGLPGTHGVPGLTMSDNPILGTNVSILVGNSKWADTLAVLLIGPRSARIPTNYGATWLVDLSAFTSVSLSIPADGYAINSNLPSDPSLAGVSIYMQAVELDPGAVKHLAFTRGLELYFQSY